MLRLFVGLVLLSSDALDWINAAPYLAPSTKRMAERLEKIAREADPLQNPFLNHGAAEIFGRQLKEALDNPSPTNTPARLVGMRYKYALELLNAGESANAVEQFTQLQDSIETNHLALSDDKVALVRMNTALAYLRLGEQENCLVNHTTDSCLMPIQPGGFHKYPTRLPGRHRPSNGTTRKRP